MTKTNKIFSGRLREYGSILTTSEVELQRVTGLSSSDISSMKDTVAQAAIKTSPVTGMARFQLKGPFNEVLRN